MKNLIRVALATALVCALAAGNASAAGSNTGSLTVQAQTQDVCFVQTGLVDFATVPGVINTPIQATGSINLQCTPNTAYTLLADAGGNSSGGQRGMHANSGLDILRYDLYTDPSYSTVMDNATNGISGTSPGNGGVFAVPLYGQLYAGQVVPQGGYADGVVVTVNYL